STRPGARAAAGRERVRRGFVALHAQDVPRELRRSDRVAGRRRRSRAFGRARLACGGSMTSSPIYPGARHLSRAEAVAILESRLGRAPQDILEAAVVLEAWGVL